MTIAAQPSPVRLERLDGLRGLAALAVVLFHFTTQFPRLVPGGEAPFAFAAGAYGVHLFFMISGFVILMSIAARGPAYFVRSRLIRLYPVFWAAVLLTSLVLWLDPLLGPPPGLVQVLANLTMLEQFVGIEPVDGAYWSLTYELGFYAMMFALFSLRLHGWLGWLPLWMALGALVFPLVSPFIPAPLHLLIGVSAYSHLFAAGLALYLARSEGFALRHWLVLALVPLAQWANDGPGGALLVAGALLAMVWGTAPAGGLPRRAAWLSKLGALSYALYLVHQMIGYVLLARLQEAGLPALPALLVVLAAVLLLAEALTRWVERPSARWLRRVLPSFGKRSARPAALAEG